jgi:hypothetical protein
MACPQAAPLGSTPSRSSRSSVSVGERLSAAQLCSRFTLSVMVPDVGDALIFLRLIPNDSILQNRKVPDIRLQ